MSAPQPTSGPATGHGASHSPQTPHSPPPTSFRSPSIGRTLSRLGSKIANTLSPGPEHGPGGFDVASSATAGSPTAFYSVGRTFADDESTLGGEKERSISRGREALTSSGRGGAGNIREASVSRTRPDSGPDDFSNARGREPRQEQTHIYSTGRGGAGNIRSPSRDVGVLKTGADEKDQGVIRSHIVTDQETGVHSTGRGGVGNIRGGGSRSRSRARDSSGGPPSIHSTGRGGVGNIFPGAVPHEIDERELLATKGHNHSHDEIHSTGRGGAANISHLHAPPVEHSHHGHHQGHYESTGRGGAGNLVRE